MPTRSTSIYEAVVALSRSLARRTDLESLLACVGDSLRKFVRFDHIGLTLHHSESNTMQGHILSEAANPAITHLTLPVDQDPAGMVWQTQQPLVVTSLHAETRWPQFIQRAADFGISSLTLIPLTAGENRLGAFGFSSVASWEPSPAELDFLQTVADEFAVAVDAFLARQKAVQERDRLRTLFDITNALVSKLSPDELFPAISEQLANVIAHDHAVLTLRNEDTGILEVYALHSSDPQLLESVKGPFNPVGMPAEQVLATRKPVVAYASDVNRYPNPTFRRFVELGLKSICSVPLIRRDQVRGTLALSRMTSEDLWSSDDVEFLAQVTKQIAIAVENSVSWRELSEMKERLATEKLYLEDEIRLDQNIGNMVGSSAAFQSVLKSIQIVAPTDSTVLILGETGTGKELVARGIHELSGRRRGSFVKVNCAAIPASLLESELFGHEKGSFTGAVAQRLGRFELAHNGTLFLDEIGEMPLELQPKLLRAIQDQEFERVGGTRTIRTNARLVAATNRDLKAMSDEGKFRSDLYYRLHVFPLNVPPLRDRRSDIAMLVRYFVQKYAQRIGRGIETIPTQALDALTKYDWPGNIRELQNVIERSVILTNGPELRVAMPEFTATAPGATQSRTSRAPEGQERARILQALKEAGGQVGGPEGAAARLGMKRTTLQSRMRKYDIARHFQ